MILTTFVFTRRRTGEGDVANEEHSARHFTGCIAKQGCQASGAPRFDLYSFSAHLSVERLRRSTMSAFGLRGTPDLRDNVCFLFIGRLTVFVLEAFGASIYVFLDVSAHFRPIIACGHSG